MPDMRLSLIAIWTCAMARATDRLARILNPRSDARLRVNLTFIPLQLSLVFRYHGRHGDVSIGLPLYVDTTAVLLAYAP